MNSHHHQQFEQNTQVGSGLTRYRSAPSSYFASLLSTPGGGGDGGFGADDFEQLFNPRVSSPETQVIFSRFMNSSAADPPPITPPPPPPRKLEPEEYHQPPPQRQSNDYSPQIMYSEAAASATDTKVFAPFNTNCAAQNKIERGGAALIRHTSSPAGFFANINIENEFKTMRSEGSFGGGNNATAEVATFSSANTFLTQMDYSSSSRGIINTISENDQFDEDHANDVDFITGLPWDDSSLISDPYLRRLQHNQKNEAENQPASLLTHHLSLPKSSAAMERLLEDSVPCKIRAKRGCATHPRSIAERVRRTKISQRMRKLQELVPNMEKQTNTSDMLDLAVDYIKDLQTQLKTLSDNRAKCTCSSKQ